MGEGKSMRSASSDHADECAGVARGALAAISVSGHERLTRSSR